MDLGDYESATLTDFKSLGLAETTLRAIASEGYDTPTPIQAQAIPPLLQGRDVVGIAQTGTGKTAAFVLPLLDRLAEIGGTARPKNTRVLVLTPTRELASQIGEAVRIYGKNIRPRSTVVVGGAKPGPQIRACAPGLDFLVATPGRLLDHVSAGCISLKEVAVVVLDEADQMLDLGFMPAVRRILSLTPNKRQTVLFSATMPQQIRSLAEDFLKDPIEIVVTPASTPVERIEQRVIAVDRKGKRDALAELLGGTNVTRAIVFTRTKRGADRVARNLGDAGIVSAAIHGDKSQGQRERALDDFKRERVRVLVATDIAARGIDIDGVTHVVNYELPNVPESYVHRIGRTARAGAEGIAISLVDPEEQPLLRDIERLIGRSLTTGEPIERVEASRQQPGPSGKPKRRRNSQNRSRQPNGTSQERGGRGPGGGHGGNHGSGNKNGHSASRGTSHGGASHGGGQAGEAMDAGVARIAGSRPSGDKRSRGQRAPVRA